MMPGLGGVDPRQMAMMMRKMGIEMRDVEDVVEVVVRTRSKEYRIRKAKVSVMKAQGQETWQVNGKVEVVDLAPSAPEGADSASPASPAAPAPATGTSPPAGAPPALAIPEEDVRLVMEQAKVDAATARKTLEACGGDLAEALVRLGA